jgi:ribonuclease E
MTRKRIGEGLLESLSTPCPTCEGRGILIDESLE